MAVWVERASKQREIDGYFSSLNCMSLRIIEDIHQVRQKCGSNWDKLTAEEQDQKIDEWMVPADIKKQYPLPESHETATGFPVLKMETGQKIVEYQTLSEQNEVATTWTDEHSHPFSFETKSQMELQLPARDDSKVQRKKSSSEKKRASKNGVIRKQSAENGGLAHETKGKSNGKVTKTESTSSRKEKSKKPKSEPKHEKEKDSFNVPDFTSGIDLDFSLGDVDFSSKNYNFPSFSSSESKIPSDGGTRSNINRNDSTKKSDSYEISNFQSYSENLPSSELSKPYDESEFLDLYPQAKQDAPKPHDDVTKPKISRSKGSKPKKTEKSFPEEVKSASSSSGGSKKKAHRKKSSSGGHQVNPRSSLTLDGAIHNLEVAAEINKQGSSSQAKYGNVFGDEDDLLQQIKKDTDADGWASASPPAVSTEKDEKDLTQKTGFDFLDNW